MENEVMNYEEEVLEAEVVETEGKSGISTGVAMAIGAGLTLAGAAVVNLVKKGIAKYKANKEAKKATEAAAEPSEEQNEATE